MDFSQRLKAKPRDTPTVEALSKLTSLETVPPTDTRKWLKFDPIQHLTVGQGDPERKYESRATERKNSVKWGQFKLLISEIDFLVRYWDPSEVAKPTVVYVGAATGHHIGVLATMFPWVQFDLYDGRPFDPNLSKFRNVTTTQSLFTEDHVRRYADRDDVFFVSDIRTLEYNQAEIQSETSLKQNEMIVKRDMDLQMGWVQAIKPVRAHLKFRLHYGHKFMVDSIPFQTYLDGTVYRQPWAPQTSTECRLVPYPDLRMRDWDYVKHESQMFYHNVVIRETGTAFENFIDTNHEPFSTELGLTNDYDSAATMFILNGYLAKLGIPQSRDNLLKLARFVIERTHSPTTLVKLRSGIREASASTEVGDTAVDDE